MIMRRRSFLTGAAATAVLTPLLASFPRPALAQSGPRVLRYIPEGDLQSPDPIWSTALVTRTHGYMVWDTLYGLDSSFQPKPQMVAGHETSQDGLTWKFTLRDGLKFHDGEPVRAADCISSIKRWAVRDVIGQRMTGRLKEIRALDDKSFEVVLTKPFPYILTAFGKAAASPCFIMPERIASDTTKAITEVIGSGPFRFLKDEWVPGSSAAYARFEDYVPRDEPADFLAGGKVARLDRVEWTVMPDPATAAAALQSGEADWWAQPHLDLVPLLRASDGVLVENYDPFGAVGLLRFNHLNPPFNNPKLRQALLPALNQRDFLLAVLGDEADNLGKVPLGPFTPGSAMASDVGMNAVAGPRDLELARKLVKESGYNGEKAVILAASDYPSINAMSLLTRDLLEKVGINVDYVSTDFGTVVQRRASKEPLDKGGWSAFVTFADGLAMADPANHYPLAGAGQSGWFGWFDSPRIEELRAQWFEAPDLDSRKAISQEIQKDFWDEMPYLPYAQWSQPFAFRSNLSNIVRFSSPVFWNVEKS